MDKTAVLKVDPDMIRCFPPASPGLEEDKVALPQSASPHLLAILFQHIGSRARQLFPVHFPINDRHETRAIDTPLRHSPQSMRHAQPMGTRVIEKNIIIGRQSHAIESRQLLRSLEIGRQDDLLLLPRPASGQENNHHQQAEPVDQPFHLPKIHTTSLLEITTSKIKVLYPIKRHFSYLRIQKKTRPYESIGL